MIVIGAMISILGNLNVSLLSASRLVFAMSERKDIPYFLSATNDRFRTPHVAILLTGTLNFFLTAFSTFVSAVTITTATRLSVYLVTCASLPVFRRRPDLADADGFRIPGGTVLAGLSIAIIAMLMYFVSLKDLVQLGAAALVGAVIYFGYRLMRGSSED